MNIFMWKWITKENIFLAPEVTTHVATPEGSTESAIPHTVIPIVNRCLPEEASESEFDYLRCFAENHICINDSLTASLARSTEHNYDI